MDVLALILHTVREQIAAIGVPPDALQDALADAEYKLRRSIGGAVHHVSRIPEVTTKARILDLVASGLTARQVSELLGVTPQYVRRVAKMLSVD